MKHNGYSNFQHEINKSLKALEGDRSESSFLDFSEKIYLGYTKHPEKFPEGADIELLTAEFYAYFLWRYRKMNHYFLDAGVADFCVSSVKDFSESYYKPVDFPLSVKLPENPPDWMAERIMANNDYTLRSGYIVHFPIKERQRSMIVLPGFTYVFNPSGRSARTYLNAIVDGVDIVLNPTLESGNPTVHADEGQNWLSRLVYGLGLYIDAFPDSVAPTNLRDTLKNREGIHTRIGRSAIMNEENRNAVSPHYRRGHFRVLTSERFTKKQGQTIFIKGTFIKGHAFDVHDDAPPIHS